MDERPGGLLYRCSGVDFVVFRSTGSAPGLRTGDGVADIEGNYPSKGARGERGAWFRDSEGNLLGVGEPVR